MLACAAVLLPFPGSLFLLLFKKSDYPHLNKTEEDHENINEDKPLLESTSSKAYTLTESFKVFKDIHFWLLFFGFFTGVGTALIILTHAVQIWTDYNHEPDDAKWGGNFFLLPNTDNYKGVFCSSSLLQML